MRKLDIMALDLVDCQLRGAKIERKENKILATFPDGKTWLFLFLSREASQSVYDRALNYYRKAVA